MTCDNTYESDVLHIAGEEYAASWVELRPKVYYKDATPHGLIASLQLPEYVILLCGAVDDRFTVGMLRDIITAYNEQSLMLVTDKESAFEHIQSVLTPYGFSFTFNEHDGRKFIMSIHIKET